jgi:Ca2+-binding RTX toxin-like protein
MALPGVRFMVSWSDQSGQNDPQDDGVVRQIFAISTPVAPNTPVALNVAASLNDTDGSETLAVSVSAIPVGATLTDGHGNTFTSTTGHTSVDVTGWSLANLSVTPPQGFTGDFQLAVNATTTDHATLTTGAVTNTKTVSQTIDVVVQAPQQQAAALVSPNTTGGTGNDVLFGGSGNDVLTGGGGNDTYQFGLGGGQDRIVNGTATSTGASGELDFGAGVNANQLWFQRNGNDLSITVMGSHDQVTVGGWFSGAGAQLAEIKTADGMKIGAGVSQLVQAMADFSSAHAGFDATTVTQAPNDTSLQNTLAASWHA